MTIVLNTIVLVVIRRQKELQEYMRVLYQILAVSDLILGSTWNLWNMFWIQGSNEKICTNVIMTFSFVYQVSVLSVMACLSGTCFNLYLLVTRPFALLYDCNKIPILHHSCRHILGDFTNLWNIFAYS